MNKLFTFLASAALISLSACSSDEPAKGNDNKGESGEKSTFYLSVNIHDANQMSRADGDTNQPTEGNGSAEGDFVEGKGDESAIDDARFYFFDKDGNYMMESQVWNGTSNSTEIHNVELESNNVLILRGLTKENLPKYLITVLNAPASFVANASAYKYGSLDDMRNALIGIYKSTESGSNRRFVMSTTSFYGGETAPNTISNYKGKYEDDKYYANVLEESNLIPETEVTKDNTTGYPVIPTDKRVDIYVERLAAKYTLSLSGMVDGYYKFPASVGGNSNLEDGGDNSGDTDIYVKVNGFDVTLYEENSYLSKNLDGFTLESANGWTTDWSDYAHHRSYWGKSINYANAATRTLTGPTPASVNTTIPAAIYTPETTAPYTDIRSSKTETSTLNNKRVTNFVIYATAYTKDANSGEYKALSFIKDGALHYTYDQYKNLLMQRLKSYGLNFYVFTGTNTDEGSLEETNNYRQITVAEANLVISRAGTDNSRIVVSVSDDVDATKWYQKNESTGKFEKITNKDAFKTWFNENYAKLYPSVDNYPTASTDGAMVYYVPVEHLQAAKETVNNNGRQVSKEGEYGVVRNHWYELNINSIKSFGRGLYEPGTGSEILTPDEETPTVFAMGARINILSWKIVKQSVNL